MCGIIFSKPHPNEFSNQLNRVISSMSILKHRGPDDGNFKQLDNVLIAHQRLSIIDLSLSHQPMQDSSGRYHLTYNGEIYNYRQLRNQLAVNWDFTTEGDTEVLLAGLIIEGSEFVKKLEGMWGFALWDMKEQELLLSRDRLGKKPLYYFHSSLTKEFHLASELPALLKLLMTKPYEDDDSRVDYLKYGYFMPGTTIYKDIFEVLPGNNLIFKNNLISQKQYWQLSPCSSYRNKQDAIDELKSSLSAAVKKRLIADVEVGAFLSGGVDSSLIVALAQQQMNNKLKTFSIGFEESSFDETHYAQQVADLYQTEHHTKVLSGVSYESLGKILSEHIGQPFADASILPTMLVSQIAASYVKVALSGDGADELFSGYQRYTSRSILRWYSKLPAIIKKNVESVIRALPEPHKHHSASLIKKAHLFSDINNRLDSETPYVAPVFFSKLEFNNLTRDNWKRGHALPDNIEETGLDDIHQMMYADSLIYLPQDILLKVDRASMLSSLETRTPFLDHKVVELAFSTPIEWHRSSWSGKRLLNNAFRKQLPANIWKRRKQGFASPQSIWFKRGLGDSFIDLLDDVDSPLDHQFIKQLISQHRSHKRDYGGKLWLLYSYFMWRKLFQ